MRFKEKYYMETLKKYFIDEVDKYILTNIKEKEK